MSELKLIALDAEDLSVLSANLQDAVLRVADVAYLPREKRFAAIANRFDWATRGAGPGHLCAPPRRRAFREGAGRPAAWHRSRQQERRAGPAGDQLRADRGAGSPEGHVTLHFADGAAIRLHVECIEAELKDLGPVWQAKSKPRHPDEDPVKA